MSDRPSNFTAALAPSTTPRGASVTTLVDFLGCRLDALGDVDALAALVRVGLRRVGVDDARLDAAVLRVFHVEQCVTVDVTAPAFVNVGNALAGLVAVLSPSFTSVHSWRRCAPFDADERVSAEQPSALAAEQLRRGRTLCYAPALGSEHSTERVRTLQERQRAAIATATTCGALPLSATTIAALVELAERAADALLARPASAGAVLPAADASDRHSEPEEPPQPGFGVAGYAAALTGFGTGTR